MATSDAMTPDPESSEKQALDVPPELIDERWLALVDAALKVQAPIAHRYVDRLRAKHPEATDRQLLEMVTRRFSALNIATGAGIGGAAALPGLGTVAAVGLTVGEGLTFAESCAFLTLAAADIHDVDMSDRNTRRLVLLAVLSGERGTEIIAKAMGKQGLQWNSLLGGNGGGFLPGMISRQVSKYIRRRMLARTGGIWLARLLPFGLGALIGAIGARIVSKSVVEAMLEIYSQASTLEGEAVDES